MPASPPPSASGGRAAPMTSVHGDTADGAHRKGLERASEPRAERTLAQGLP